MNDSIKNRLIPLLITAGISILLIPIIVFAQINVPQGGTGNNSFPGNALLVSDSASFQRIQATSSDPLYVGSLTATTSNASIFAGGIIVTASSTFTGPTTTVTQRMTVGTTSPVDIETTAFYAEAISTADHAGIFRCIDAMTVHCFMVEAPNGSDIFTIESSGETEIIHTATENGDHTLHLETQVNGFGDVVGIFNDFDAGTMAAGEDASGLLITVDRTSTTGGDIHGLLVFTTAAGGAEVIGLELGVGVFPIRHNSGTFGDMDECTSTAGGDILSSCTSTGSDVTLFASNNDALVIGDAAQFTSIDVSLATESSKNINATFEFSTGNDTWTTFSPSDGTNGFQDTSVIAWELSDIPSWATGTSTRYFIRITRTRAGNIATPPVEDKLQISAVTEFVWDDLGNVNVNVLNASSTHLVDGLSTLTGLISTASSTFGAELEVTGAFSASSTAIFNNLVTVSDLTSAMIITSATGLFTEYAGTSCSNQFVRSLSVLGAATCNSVSAGDYAAASIDGDDINSNLAGRSLTLTAASPDTLDADTELFTRITTFIVSSSTMSTSTDSTGLQHKWASAITISRISCTTDTGTSSIQFDERAEATPNTAGTDVIGDGVALALECGSEFTNATTSFQNAGIATDVPLNFTIEDAQVAEELPIVIRVHVDYTYDD